MPIVIPIPVLAPLLFLVGWWAASGDDKISWRWIVFMLFASLIFAALIDPVINAPNWLISSLCEETAFIMGYGMEDWRSHA